MEGEGWVWTRGPIRVTPGAHPQPTAEHLSGQRKGEEIGAEKTGEKFGERGETVAAQASLEHPRATGLIQTGLGPGSISASSPWP